MLKADKYNREPYHTKDLNEGMVLIWEWGWMGGPEVMCPLYLVNHNAKCAYPIVDTFHCMVYFKSDDIDWDSLKSIETEREIIHNYEKRLGNTTYDDYKGTAFGALETDFRWYYEEEPELYFHTFFIKIGKFKNGIATIIWQYCYRRVFERKKITLYGIIDDKAQFVCKFDVAQIENDD